MNRGIKLGVLLVLAASLLGFNRCREKSTEVGEQVAKKKVERVGMVIGIKPERSYEWLGPAECAEQLDQK